jgi:hypothetical protein
VVEREALPLGPNGRPLCRWCLMEILAKRRRTFCSDYCVHQWRLRSDPGYLRDQVLLRDAGVCAECGLDTVKAYRELKKSRGDARAEALGDAQRDGEEVVVGRGPYSAGGRGRRRVRSGEPADVVPYVSSRGNGGVAAEDEPEDVRPHPCAMMLRMNRAAGLLRRG